MELITTEIAKIIIEILAVLAGSGLVLLMNAGVKHLNVLRQKDTLGLVDILVNGAIHVAEKEFSGQAGVQKKDFVLKKVSEQLADRGIKISPSEIESSVEKGVSQLNLNKPVTVVLGSVGDES